MTKTLIASFIFTLILTYAAADSLAQRTRGSLIISGAAGLSREDFGTGVIEKFVTLTGGPDANNKKHGNRWYYWLEPGSLFNLRTRSVIERRVRDRTPLDNVTNASGDGPSPAAARPCERALAQHAVCEAANRRALEIMQANKLEAITVVQEVQTGALITFAASEPDRLDVTTPLMPLSTVKLMLASSWWNHDQPEDPKLRDAPPMSVTEMIIKGNDLVGKRMASELRKSIGTTTILKDLEHYGFLSRSKFLRLPVDRSFWSSIDERWRNRLQPKASYVSLSMKTTKQDWEDTLSIGEAGFVVTALHLSRYLQAVGNGGVMVAPCARRELFGVEVNGTGRSAGKAVRVMREDTAAKLQEAMRGVVRSGTATSIADALGNTGWQIGGKTGTGPGPAPPGPQSDGWFAGLIFDARGQARFTVATFVRRGGLGGGNAARISAELARILIEGSN